MVFVLCNSSPASFRASSTVCAPPPSPGLGGPVSQKLPATLAGPGLASWWQAPAKPERREELDRPDWERATLSGWRLV